MDTAEICTELRNMADGICTKLKQQCDQYETAIKSLTEDRDVLAARLKCARNELESLKAQYAASIAEYVELADRGIIRDSIIRELLKQLRAERL